MSASNGFPRRLGQAGRQFLLVEQRQLVRFTASTRQYFSPFSVRIEYQNWSDFPDPLRRRVRLVDEPGNEVPENFPAKG